MDISRYVALSNYLTDQVYPLGCNIEKEKRSVRTMARRYISISGRLYTKSKDGRALQEVLHTGNADEIILKVHGEGHFGVTNTWRRLRLEFDGYHLYERVKKLVQSCDTCQRRARRRHVRVEPSRPIPIPPHPFFMIGVDAVGPVPESKLGNKYLLVAVDYLTKWPVVAAVPNINEVTTAEFLFHCVVKDFGVPSYILTDRGSNFLSGYVEHFLKRIGCRHLTTTAFRPQTNGLVERMNQTVVNTLAKIVRNDEDDLWDLKLDEAVLAIRTMPNEATGVTPSMMLFGYNMRTPALWSAPREDFVQGDYPAMLQERLDQISGTMANLKLEARKKVTEKQQKTKIRYDEKVYPKIYEVGSKVLLMENYTVGKKFGDKWIGPFVVARSFNNGTYQLVGPGGKRIEKPVNGDQLKLYVQAKTMIPQVTSGGQQLEQYLDRRRLRDVSDFETLL